MLNWLKKLKASSKRRRSGTSTSEQKETGTESNNVQVVENTDTKPRKTKKSNQKQDPRAGKTSRKKSRVSPWNEPTKLRTYQIIDILR